MHRHLFAGLDLDREHAHLSVFEQHLVCVAADLDDVLRA
jgi:hypothetical protein